MKQTFSISTPVKIEIFCRSPLKDSLLYPLPISSIWVLHFEIKAESFDNDCFPLPPTPMSIAFPRGKTNILEILSMCWMASLKKTSYNLPLVSILYSYILDSRNSVIFLISSTCSYITSSVSRVVMVVKVTPSSFPFILSPSTPSPNLLLIAMALFSNQALSSSLINLSLNILYISWYHTR